MSRCRSVLGDQRRDRAGLIAPVAAAGRPRGATLRVPHPATPHPPPPTSTPDRGREGDAEAGAGGAATPARCRRLFPRAHPEPRRAIAERSTKRGVLGSGATRCCGRGRGHPRPRRLCPSTLAWRRGRLTCSLAGLPRPPAQRRTSCGPAAEGPRAGQHREPGTGTPLPQHPPTHPPGRAAGARRWGGGCGGPGGGRRSPARGTAAPR